MERQDSSVKRERSVGNDGPVTPSSTRGARDNEHDGPSDNDGTDSTATATTQETANLSRLATSTPLSHLAAGESQSPSPSHSPLKPIAVDSPDARELSPGRQHGDREAVSKDESRVYHTSRPPDDQSRASLLREQVRQEFEMDRAEGKSTPVWHACLKVLVTNNVAGSIIGKSGESILKLQKDCNCRIKLSQAHDFFPGTSDRVCLLQSEAVDNVKLGVDLILRRVRDARDALGESDFSSDDHECDTKDEPGSTMMTVRILVPNPACGMIIGRGGSNIKSISSSTNSKIQMTQKEDMASVATSERVVTVTGTMQACTSCIGKVLDAMALQPEVSQYSNMTTSYRKNVNPTVSASPIITPRFRSHTNEPPPGGPDFALGGFADLAISSSVSPRMSSLDPHNLPQAYIPNVQPGQYAPVDSRTMFRPTDRRVSLTRGYSTTEHSRLSRTDDLFIPMQRHGPGLGPMVPSFGVTQGAVPPPMALSSTPLSLQVGVPETMIGAILGRGGSGINELQMSSGARIEVSQRGTFQPGTNNRIITITGTEQACATASFLINQRLTRPGTGMPHR